MTAQSSGFADSAADTLSRLVQDPSCPQDFKVDALSRLADLCLNSFGDADAARVLLQRRSALNGSSLDAELASIVADQYSGQSDASTMRSRLVTLARTHLPANQPKTRRGRVAQRRSALRVALLGNQWCASPVGFLAMGALREMSRHADLLFFDRGGKADWARACFQELAREWHDVKGVTAVDIRSRITDCEADALIDFCGWTDPAALQALSHRPAPVQLKWIGGQSSTTGAHCFDGFIADERQIPRSCDGLYTEPIMRADLGYVTYTPPPYWRIHAAVRSPPTAFHPRSGARDYAIAANPLKISLRTIDFLRQLQPSRLLLIDHRWRHRNTRRVGAARLGDLMEVVEFITPATHPEFLATLAATDAVFVDTAPYSMGLAAVELRLLGKPIIQPPRSALRSISESHCIGHLGATSFDHHAELGAELLRWCDAR